MRTRSGGSSSGGTPSDQSSGYSSSGSGLSQGPGSSTAERSSRESGAGPQVSSRRWARGGAMMTPWDLMRRATEEMSRMLETIDTGRSLTPGLAAPGLAEGGQTGAADRRGISTAMFVPPIEVEQRADSVIVRTDLPGIEADQIHVTVNEGVLNISGERTQESREEAEGYIRSERRYGRFYRAIPLPDGVDEDKVHASFNNGVLEITIPVSERQQGRQIPVQSTSQGQSRTQGQRTGTQQGSSTSESRSGQGSQSYAAQSSQSGQGSQPYSGESSESSSRGQSR